MVQFKIIPPTVISKKVWDLDDKHFSCNSTDIGRMTQTNRLIFRFLLILGTQHCVPGTLPLLVTNNIIAHLEDGQGTMNNLSQKIFSYTATLSPLMWGKRCSLPSLQKDINSVKDNCGKPAFTTRVVALVSTFNPHVRTHREGWPFQAGKSQHIYGSCKSTPKQWPAWVMKHRPNMLMGRHCPQPWGLAPVTNLHFQIRLRAPLCEWHSVTSLIVSNNRSGWLYQDLWPKKDRVHSWFIAGWGCERGRNWHWIL